MPARPTVTGVRGARVQGCAADPIWFGLAETSHTPTPPLPSDPGDPQLVWPRRDIAHSNPTTTAKSAIQKKEEATAHAATSPNVGGLLEAPPHYIQPCGVSSFEGLDKPTSKKDNYGKKMVNTYRGSYQELKEVIRLYGLDDDIVITKGNIVNTLPKFLKNDNSMFSFVYCDTDSYAPTKTILENLHSRMPVNGIFVFDEYNYEQWGGETKAVNEFLDKFGAHYEVNNITNTRQPTMYLKKQSPHLH